ncbi:pyridoxal phosphate-dependent transferase [Massariosphaeria phaeospora]|uniref:Pyridoxal phosphate-dependent transferase n=1 Tax=Massariosphaeria phaeospora TaxID=100035 RepID=A0A7C8MBI7_9PLEO|nr:pyridoxal phosphate-dependent transferase [Massariosphaeria phaeospora]
MDDDPTDSPLETRLRTLLQRRQAHSTLRTLTTTTPHQTDFSSNDFLSLATSAHLKTAFLAELAAAQLPLGSGGSRLLDGNSPYAENLEREIADFHGASAGLLFNSGFDANAGFFACVPQAGDVVVYDELIHASVHDGMRLSRAGSRVPFRHNCVQDLRRVLGACVEGVRARKGHVIVAVETVYSMDGDLAPLQEIVETVEEVLPKGMGYVVIDEAHSTGVLGPRGRGLVCALGLERRVFARLHTFGKALACGGAIILGSSVLRLYLINYARPLIYTTFLSYPALAAIRASYSLLQNGHTVQLAAHLRALIQNLYSELHTLTINTTFRALLTVPPTCPRSPIFSIQLAEPKILAKFLQDKGMMVRAVVPPTVPEGTSRVRICLHAGNTEADIGKLVASLEEWCLQRRDERVEEKTGAAAKRRGFASAQL